jgi:mannose-1-phosphate guanylyltransferase
MANTYVAIMAGGIGSRFWPRSRASMPKQFIDILGLGKTLIQSTYDRFRHICDADQIYVVTNEGYRPIVSEQLPDLGQEQILGEPMRRNTAPCIAYVAQCIYAKDPDANIIVAPSDHLITDEASFYAVIEKAMQHIQEHEDLITLGIRPTRPDTGYGYIQYEEDLQPSEGVHKVKTFTEKPNLELAKTFLSSGDFLWNSGIFVWKARTILDAFSKHLPEVGEAFQGIADNIGQPEHADSLRQAYSIVTNISIDYGVMEKAENVMVIPASFGWSDLGTWGSLYDRYSRDYLGNAVNGDNVMIYDATNCMIMAPDNKLVVVQGLDDFLVVDTENILLICEKEKEQYIKQITGDVKRKKGDRFL